MKPGAEALIEVAAKFLSRDARVLDLVSTTPTDPVAQLGAYAAAPADAILAAWPTADAPLLPFLHAARAALRETGRLFILDLAWQTAPTPELLRAFAPAPGRDKVRPIEGYEMQMDHAGLAVVERVVVEPARWAAGLPAEQRAALASDSRGAARLTVWVVGIATDE